MSIEVAAEFGYRRDITVTAVNAIGYVVETDWWPVRVELAAA